ncbi:LpqB family beta-propeller domain-containing protein [Aquipuribacter sp. SD81]|uniref:LpqB family beta-propeller domain-containing protein n=1 Tax=Aquipuribacter sp. SD81 TaxID=3127703 RepID=UPI00301A751D
MTRPTTRPGDTATGAPHRPRVLAALVAALALLLAGCASLPTSGRVVAGGDVDQQGVRQALRVVADGPAPGADEEEVVSGFLAAVAGLDDFAVAREFLAPDAQAWRPGDRTVVYEGAPTAVADVEGDTATVTVTAPVVARIDGNGRYTAQAPTPEEQRYELVRVDGEWRIADLPVGVLVSQVDADRVLTPYGVYFPDPTGRYLVPDVRWFPQLSSSATSLVRALLAGPSAPYLGALSTAVPQGTRLGLATVPVENGVATVDLTEDVLDAESAERALLLAQLRQTLRAVPGVTTVAVTVEGSPVDEPLTPELGADQLRVDPTVDDRVLVLGPPPVATEETEAAGATPDGPADGADGDAAAGAEDAGATDAGAAAGGEEVPVVDPVLGPDGRPLAPEGWQLLRLDLDGGQVVEGTEALADLVATGIAASPDGSTYAGLDADRSSMWVQQPGAPPVELVTGASLTRPSFDPLPLSSVWTVTAGEADGPPRVLASAATVQEVDARWLRPGDEVRALRVSRDGARVLVVVARADGSVVAEVRGVRRDPAGRPESLSQASFTVAPQLVDAVDAAWVSDDQVVVLGREGEEPLRPVLARVGGESTPLAPAPGAVSVSAGFGERSIVVGTEEGTVLRRSGSLWLDGPVGVSPAHRG